MDNINQGNEKNFKVAPEDSVSRADREDAEEEEEPSFPARVNVVVEKPGKGALAIETVAQDGMIVIDNVYYFADAAHAHAKTAEKIHERQDLYAGPPFSNLDEDLQVLLEKYLEERGINTALAIFVPDYIDMKEQREYLTWLSNVKRFVEA
jgi:complement component 1 Q subcomponent-binding protein